jgi:hypothetical protein
MTKRIFLSYGGLVLIGLLWDIFVAQQRIPVVMASRENAVEAIGLLKDWSTWLAGIEIASIAAVGAILKDSEPVRHKWLGLSCVAAFGCSLMAATWLLGSLPRVALTVEAQPAAANDIVGRVMPFYLFPPYVTIPVRVGLMIVYEHMFFLIGVWFFCWLLIAPRKRVA